MTENPVEGPHRGNTNRKKLLNPKICALRPAFFFVPAMLSAIIEPKRRLRICRCGVEFAVQYRVRRRSDRNLGVRIIGMARSFAYAVYCITTDTTH